MATTTAIGGSEGTASGSGVIVRGIRNGLVASIAMAMVMMLLGIVDRGFFAAPSSIWAFWAGPGAYAPTTFSLGFVLGAMGHMMNAAVLGIVFGLISSKVLRLAGTGEGIVAGTVFALAVMAVLWVAVLPLSPNGSIVKESASLWVWIMGHVAYGMTAGFLYVRWR